MTIDIISINEYNSEQHPHYRKFVQVRDMKTAFSSRLRPTAQWIFFANEEPVGWQLPPGFSIKEVQLTDDVKEGDIFDEGTSSFLRPKDNLRRLFSDEELLGYIRTIRSSIFAKIDPLILRHISQVEGAKTLSIEQFFELQAYAQQLRDFPAVVDLNNIIWPTKPSFIL